MSFGGLTGLPLLVVAAGALGLVVVLYTLRQRPPRRVVSTTSFWSAPGARKRGSGRLGSLDHLLSLFLMLIVASAIVLAAAEPRLRFQSPAGRQVMIVLDRSSSMGAIEKIEPRLVIAKRRALARITRASSHDAIGLVLSGGAPEIAVPLSIDRTPLLRAVDGAPLRAGPGRLADAVALACSTLAAPDASLVVVTDGSEPIGACPSASLETLSVGAALDNVGVTALATATAPRDPRHADAFVEVQNTSPWHARAELRLDLDGALLHFVPLELAPGGREHRDFDDVPLTGQGRLVARLARIQFYDVVDGKERPVSETDALGEDDTAYAVVARRASLPVRLVGDSAPMRLVLAANPRYLVSSEARPDGVTVIVGPVRQPLGAGRYLLVDPQGPAELPFQLGRVVKNPRITYWRDEHPVLRRVVLSDVLVGQATSVELSAAATPLAGSPETPLVFSLVDGPTRAVGLTFALENSDLPLRVAFPVLVYNAIDWLAQQPDDDASAFTIASGQAVEIRGPSGARRVSPIDGRVPLSGDAPGFYEVRSADGKPLRTFAVSVTDPGETAIAPRPLPPSPTVRAGRLVDRELAPWLLLLALAVLLIEWVTYHRRITV